MLEPERRLLRLVVPPQLVLVQALEPVQLQVQALELELLEELQRQALAQVPEPELLRLLGLVPAVACLGPRQPWRMRQGSDR